MADLRSLGQRQHLGLSGRWAPPVTVVEVPFVAVAEIAAIPNRFD